MTPRSWGILIFFAALVAGALAFRLGVDPVLASALVACVGLAVLIVVVSRDARRKLAVNRADLMRAAGMCPACGYTIRAATERCPECGAPRT